MISQILSIVIPCAVFVGGIYWLSTRYLPALIQQVLNDVGGSISEQITSTFAEPNVKRAMTIIGRKGNEQRTDNNLRERVADKVLGASPLIGKVLDYFDITPLEGLQLYHDPIIGPFIQGAIESYGKGGTEKTINPFLDKLQP